MYYFFYCVLRLTDKTFAQFIGSAKQAREKLWAVTKEVLNMRRSIGSLAARLSDERRLLKGIAETHADGRGANRIPAFLSACFRKGMSATTVHAQLVKAIADEYTVPTAFLRGIGWSSPAWLKRESLRLVQVQALKLMYYQWQIRRWLLCVCLHLWHPLHLICCSVLQRLGLLATWAPCVL